MAGLPGSAAQRQPWGAPPASPGGSTQTRSRPNRPVLPPRPLPTTKLLQWAQQATGPSPPSNGPGLAEAKPHQLETACGDRIKPAGRGEAGWAKRSPGRLSRSDRTTRHNPQRPCPGRGSEGQICGKTPPKLWKTPCGWGNPPPISRTDAWPANCVAKAAEMADLALNPEELTWGAPQRKRLGPIGPCVGLATETDPETASGGAMARRH